MLRLESDCALWHLENRVETEVLSVYAPFFFLFFFNPNFNARQHMGTPDSPYM